MTSFIPSIAGRDSGPERRLDPRKALRANAELMVAGQSVRVRTLDISKSGIGISASINPRGGQAASLLLAPPEDPRGTARVEIPVAVIHSILTRAEGEFKIGLRFGTLAPEADEVVRKYLSA